MTAISKPTEACVCPACGQPAAAGEGPVTSSGWYGDVRYARAVVGGVCVCRAVRYRCSRCVTEWPADEFRAA